ncbi:hypothetical protein [Streptomyces sp. NPDC050738]|uniref:hypothetical protein n=1 Tax=Streptomyces sp. NPDC050738 TaxID=3154744 RepID=UPI003434F6EA
MLHDVVLPGARPPNLYCELCNHELPRAPKGWIRAYTEQELQRRYEAAEAGNREPLDEYLTTGTAHFSPTCTNARVPACLLVLFAFEPVKLNEWMEKLRNYL